MKIARIHHVALMCADYEKTKQFYTELLGLPIVRENYTESNGVYKLDLAISDSFQIEIFHIPTRESENRSDTAVLHHIALEIEDIVGTAAELRDHGIAVDEIKVDPHTGKRYTFFKDPDGVPLELYEG